MSTDECFLEKTFTSSPYILGFQQIISSNESQVLSDETGMSIGLFITFPLQCDISADYLHYG